MKREIVLIDEDKCNGCGLCIPNCHEGALQMIDGKARLISDLMCDGLGACLGHCPQGAITIEEREAEPYDEKKVMAENIAPKGENTIKAHLLHLKDHNETEFFNQAVEYLEENDIPIPNLEEDNMHNHAHDGGCPGARMMDFGNKDGEGSGASGDMSGSRPSQLKQWPVQLHLVPPTAPYFQGKDVLLAADCTAYALGDMHKDYMKDKGVAIACPKLDSEQEIYEEKLVSMIDDAKINTLTVMIMEVPCCGGLLQMAKNAASKAERKIPLKAVMVGIQGNILSEDWV